MGPWGVLDDGVAPADPNPASRVWSLEGTTWVLTEIRDADGAWPLPGGIRATLEIIDGHVHVEAGCNTGHASVSLHNDTIQIGPMALTRMMCPDLAMKVEAAVTSVLQGNVPYLLNADVLALGTASRLLVYRSDLPPAA
jgi:heat shock protein HslJ